MNIKAKVNLSAVEKSSEKRQYLTMRVDKQLFGIVVDTVQDVLSPMKITPIPLSPPEVKGTLNLRGRIVTAINLRARLGMDERKVGNSELENSAYRSVVVEIDGNLYSIIIDSVAEVLSIGDSQIERLPENISNKWKDVSVGVFPMENELMIFLDVEKILNVEDNSFEEEEY